MPHCDFFAPPHQVTLFETQNYPVRSLPAVLLLHFCGGQHAALREQVLHTWPVGTGRTEREHRIPEPRLQEFKQRLGPE